MISYKLFVNFYYTLDIHTVYFIASNKSQQIKSKIKLFEKLKGHSVTNLCIMANATQ